MSDIESKVAILEERIETRQAELRADLTETRLEVLSAFERLAESMELCRHETARRETQLVLGMACMIGLAVAVLSCFIALS